MEDFEIHYPKLYSVDICRIANYGFKILEKRILIRPKELCINMPLPYYYYITVMCRVLLTVFK